MFTEDQKDELLRRLEQGTSPYIAQYPHGHPTSEASFRKSLACIQYHVDLLFALHGTVVAGVGVHPSKGVMEIFPQQDDLIRNRLIEGLTTNPLGAQRLRYVADLVEEVDLRRKQLFQIAEPMGDGSDGEPVSNEPEISRTARDGSENQQRFAPIVGERPWSFAQRKQHLVPLFQVVFSNKWTSRRAL